jgi:hypothetical protein
LVKLQGSHVYDSGHKGPVNKGLGASGPRGPEPKFTLHLLDAATGLLQNENKKPWNEWWDDECRKAMEEKNLARMKCINRRTRTNQNDYKQKRKTANGICKRKKKERLNDKREQIEEANKKNESRKFYKNSAF